MYALVPGVAVLSGITWFILWPYVAPGDADNGTPAQGADAADITPSERPADNSPFAVRLDEGRVDSASAASQQSQHSSDADSASLADTNSSLPLPSLDKPLSEADFMRWVEQLRRDPALLSSLIDQFRQETDPVLKRRIADLLGEIGGEQITQLASELVSSGDEDSRTLGMSLLQDVQAGNSQARDMVSSMLSTELETPMLIDALSALANPGEVDSSSRQSMADQVALLTSHEDDGVRSISLDVLSRWSQESRYTDILMTGLDDESQYVRAAAAYALVGRDNESPSVLIDRLFSVARDPDEVKRVKSAALLALKSLPLTELQLVQVGDIKRQINTVSR